MACSRVNFTFTFTLCIDILTLNNGEEEEDEEGGEEEKHEGDEEENFGRDIPMWYMKKKIDYNSINTIFIMKIVLHVSACDSHFSTTSALVYFLRLMTFNRTRVDGESREEEI